MSDPNPGALENASPGEFTGRRLGDFQILRRLGRGAMAEVYLAEQGSLRRQVAVKVLKRELAGDSLYVQRFHNEARAAAALTHANIVQIYDVGQINGVHYIAQEYVPGRNLGQLLQRSGRVDARLVAAVLRQVAAALHKAAEHGIVHRDIKPENVMLTREGEVKVADFGLARFTDAGSLHLTQVGVTMGTPLYMSPEQLEGKPLDTRADIYSLGVTCYHLLAGAPPFLGDSALAVAVHHLNTPAKPLEKLCPDAPAGLCRIIHKMMSKKAADRYVSARELLLDLRSVKLGDADEDSAWDEGWSIPEMIALTDARIEATQRLEAVMRTQSLTTSRPTRYRLLAAGVVLALAIGLTLGLLARPQSLLHEAESPRVPKRGSVWAQLYHAKLADSEAAWQSVPQYFPDDEFGVRLAQQGLVRHYIWQTAEYDKALPVLDELSRLGDTQAPFRAFGLAGRCVVLSLLGRQDEAARQFDQLTPEVFDTLDIQMRTTLEEVMTQSRAAMTRDAARKLEQLKQTLNGDSPT